VDVISNSSNSKRL